MRSKVKVMAAAGLALILAGAGLYAFLAARGRQGPAETADGWPGVELPSLLPVGTPVLGGASNLLLVGLSEETRSGKAFVAADTVVVVRLDERLRRAACLFIPRTTLLEIRDQGRRTLDELYSLGGLPLLRQSLQDLTGLVFDHWMLLERRQFAWLVDLCGGINHTLTQPVSDPRWGSLEAGAALLDGNGAVLVNAYTGYEGGEPGRIRAQQSFLLSAAAQLHRAASRPGFAWIVNLAAGVIQGDLPTGTLLGLAREFASWPVADLSLGTAPGANGSIGGKKVYLLDEEALRRSVESMVSTVTVPAP